MWGDLRRKPCSLWRVAGAMSEPALVYLVEDHTDPEPTTRTKSWVAWCAGKNTLRSMPPSTSSKPVSRDCAANGVFGPTRRAEVRWDGHCE